MSIQDIYTLIPLAVLGIGATALLIAGAFLPGSSVRALNLAGATIALASAGAAAYYHPQQAVVGGMVLVDGLGRLFMVLPALAAAFTLLLSTGYAGRRPMGREEYPSLVLFAAFGMALLGTSVSLLGVFLGLESMSLALYVLLASNKSDPLSGEAGLKYLIIGAVSTAFFAFGLSLVYVATGDLSIAGSMRALSASGSMSPLGLAGWTMLLVGIGFKVAAFPFQFWAPDVYQGGPAPVVAFLSTGSKAAVVAALIRLASASGPGWGSLSPVIWVMAALTVSFGNIAALTQDNIKRLLAYSSVAQMGYVLIALIATPATGGVAAVFYVISYVLMDLGAFGVVAAFSVRDRDLGTIDDLRGLGFTHPFRSMALAVCMVSLAGLPPTAGFIAKFGVFYAAVKAGYVYLAAVGILAAIVSVYYYLRVVVYLYMPAPGPEPTSMRRGPMPALDVSAGLTLAVVVFGIIVLGVLPGGLLTYLASFMEG